MTIVKGRVLSNKESCSRYYEKHKSKKSVSVRNYTRRVRQAAIDILGGFCVNCGFSDVRALQIDHLQGGGGKETKHYKGAAQWNKVIKSVLNKEKRFQLLCANCNWIKRVENREVRPLIYD